MYYTAVRHVMEACTCSITQSLIHAALHARDTVLNVTLTTHILVQPVAFSSRKYRKPCLEMTGLTRISSTAATNCASSSFSMSRNGDAGRRRASWSAAAAAAAAMLSLDSDFLQLDSPDDSNLCSLYHINVM